MAAQIAAADGIADDPAHAVGTAGWTGWQDLASQVGHYVSGQRHI